MVLGRNFSQPHWDRLGLQLGLLHPTLEAIESDCRGKASKCLQECLAAWLRKEDNVMDKGGPSWSSLAASLDNIGYRDIAETVRRNMKN